MSLTKAHAAQGGAATKAKAAQRMAARAYHVDWRSTGAVTIVGRAATAKALGISEASLGVYLSNGKAQSGLARPHPETGELDIVTVTFTDAPEPKPAPKPKGRPRKDRAEQP